MGQDIYKSLHKSDNYDKKIMHSKKIPAFEIQKHFKSTLVKKKVLSIKNIKVSSQ